MEISIHTLTQRVTLQELLGADVEIISIHTLTQRVTRRYGTKIGTGKNFNPHPHAEGDLKCYGI